MLLLVPSSPTQDVLIYTIYVTSFLVAQEILERLLYTPRNVIVLFQGYTLENCDVGDPEEVLV